MTHPRNDTALDIAAPQKPLSYGIRPPGYRLPDEAHPGRVSLQVADLQRSLTYYEKVLGLRLLEQSTTGATLGAAGGSTSLVELHERAGAKPVSRRGRLGLYHFAILLPERAALGRFVDHLGRLGEYAGMSDHLVSEAVYLTDPDGLGIEVYADRPRSSWRTQEQQLVMATEPLDRADLVRAGGGEPWTGMPAGTVLGHVHLYVADLDAAAAFYHAGLGFDKIVWNYPGALFLSAGGYHHHLGTNTWAAQAPRAEESDARLLEWTLVVPHESDVDRAARSLAAGGHDVRQEAGDAIVADPWGTHVRITGRPGASAGSKEKER